MSRKNQWSHFSTYLFHIFENISFLKSPNFARFLPSTRSSVSRKSSKCIIEVLSVTLRKKVRSCEPNIRCSISTALFCSYDPSLGLCNLAFSLVLFGCMHRGYGSQNRQSGYMNRTIRPILNKYIRFK